MPDGLFGNTLEDLFDNSLTTLTMESETGILCALFDSTGVAAWDFDSATAAYTASNEISGTGYTAKGFTETATEISIAAGVLTFDAIDASWSGATFSGVRGALIFDDSVAAPVADCAIVGVDFGSDYAVTAGVFTVQWNAGGIYTLDYTP